MPWIESAPTIIPRGQTVHLQRGVHAARPVDLHMLIDQLAQRDPLKI